MPEWNKVFITPQKFHDDIIKLCNMIPKYEYEFVKGVPRGGLILATYISHYCELKFINANEFPFNQSKILIVDDLTDSGITLEKFKKFDTAVLYYKPRSSVKPTYFVEQSPNDQWIVFPYERPDEEPNREI